MQLERQLLAANDWQYFRHKQIFNYISHSHIAHICTNKIQFYQIV